MRVLVACEFSGIVRDAFAARGHDARSCDLLPTERPGKHLQQDVCEILEDHPDGGGWDMMIAFPPCTYLCSSGLHWNKRRPGRDALTYEAMKFVFALLDAPIPRIALENPVGCISTNYRKPDQIIQPWQFGTPESKATCLWLKNLPPLTPTKICEPEYYKNADGTDYRDRGGKGSRYSKTHYLTGRMQARWRNQTPNGQNKLGPSPTRAMERSRTYRGIADAMADQWSAPVAVSLFS